MSIKPYLYGAVILVATLIVSETKRANAKVRIAFDLTQRMSKDLQEEVRLHQIMRGKDV